MLFLEQWRPFRSRVRANYRQHIFDKPRIQTLHMCCDGVFSVRTHSIWASACLGTPVLSHFNVIISVLAGLPTVAFASLAYDVPTGMASGTMVHYLPADATSVRLDRGLSESELLVLVPRSLTREQRWMSS